MDDPWPLRLAVAVVAAPLVRHCSSGCRMKWIMAPIMAPNGTPSKPATITPAPMEPKPPPLKATAAVTTVTLANPPTQALLTTVRWRSDGGRRMWAAPAG